MRYWDASGLVPLIVEESSTQALRSLVADDPQIVTWAWSMVEITGAVERRVRIGQMDRATRRSILGRLNDLAMRWDEVSDLTAVRRRAVDLLARHPLRAADAAQLGAALLVADLGIPDLEFVCLDGTLSLAAELEGLVVNPGL